MIRGPLIRRIVQRRILIAGALNIVNGCMLKHGTYSVVTQRIFNASDYGAGKLEKQMVAEAKEVARQRFRESYGRYLEDFKVGDVYEHRPGRSITETDNTWFTLLTMNQHPLHFDREYGAKTEFGQVVVNSCLTISLVTGMSVSDISQKTIANLGWDKVRLTGPVFVGDTLYAESTVLSIRESASRPNQGIVTVESRGIKQDGQQVISFERSMLIPKRGHAIDDKLDY